MAFTYWDMRCTFHQYCSEWFGDSWTLLCSYCVFCVYVSCVTVDIYFLAIPTCKTFYCLLCGVCDRGLTQFYLLLLFVQCNLHSLSVMVSLFSIFSVTAGWIAEILFMPILLYNGQNKAEYEVYLLMGVSIINYWGARQSLFLFKAVCAN